VTIPIWSTFVLKYASPCPKVTPAFTQRQFLLPSFLK
jgi:hypothetical protein